MDVSIQVEYKADRKEPLGEMLRRVMAAFAAAGIVPNVRASFGDGPAIAGMNGVSAVQRALKKWPHLAPFEHTSAPAGIPGLLATRRLGDLAGPVALAWDDVLALADGVPRSLPFHAVLCHFEHPEFGSAGPWPVGMAPQPGILVHDSWWVSGRNRALTAFYSVEGEATAKKLPDPLPSAKAVLDALGKPRTKKQFVSPAAMGFGAARAAAAGTELPPQVQAVSEIVQRYRTGMPEMLRRLALPHDLRPPEAGAARVDPGSGPLKPALEAAFEPLGYDCKGGRGIFTLRKRTAQNHVLQLELDVGTWSRMVSASFSVEGPSLHAAIRVPVSAAAAMSFQFAIGDVANWERIVANYTVIVGELERTFVPEVEAAVGPAPEWFEPGR